MSISEKPYSTEKNKPPVPAGDFEEQCKRLHLRATMAEQLTDASIDCVVAMDLQGNVMHWNATCAQFSGIKAADIVGKNFRDFFPDMIDSETMVRAFHQVKLGRKVFVPAEEDHWLRGYFEIHLVPLKHEDGHVNGILLIAHDVAHRVKAELELKELNHRLQEKYAELERANSELATFTHITSHDLKEPLRKIYSLLEKTVIDEGSKLTTKGRGTIRKVQSTVQRIGLLADSLITFSELQHELVELVPLNRIVKDSLAQLKPQIHEHEAAITVAELPRVKGDPEQLKTLFLHLISNAVKFHEEGKKPVVAIKASEVRSDKKLFPNWVKQQRYWCLSVEDNGIGIAPEDRDRIFNLFEKGEQPGKYSGAGVGLALVKKIASNHGGLVEVKAASNGGSVFSCYFPVASDATEN